MGEGVHDTNSEKLPISHQHPTPDTSKNWLEEYFSALAFIAVFSLLQLPYEKIDGNPVPTIIFKNLPAYFHAFVLGLNFAFCGGIMTISLRQLYPRIAGVCRCICVLSMLVSVTIFVGLAVPWAMVAFHPDAPRASVAAV